jgi:hypothetical protein
MHSSPVQMGFVMEAYVLYHMARRCNSIDSVQRSITGEADGIHEADPRIRNTATTGQHSELR